MSTNVQDTFTSIADFKANVPTFKLSDLNLHIVIVPEGVAKEIHVLARRPTIDVLDGIQRMLKETEASMTDRIKDVVGFQLIPLLLAWNITDDAGEIVPFDMEVIVKNVPADVLNVLVTTISNTMNRPEGVPDPNAPAST